MKAVRLTAMNSIRQETAGSKNDIRILNDEMAADMILAQIAEYAPEFDPPTAEQQQAATELTQLTEDLGLYNDAPAPEPSWTDSLPGRHVDEPVTVTEVPADGIDWPASKRPYGNHSKAMWVRYAVHEGANPGEAARMTKNELMAAYGEAL